MTRLILAVCLFSVCGCNLIEPPVTELWLKHVEKMTNWVQADAEAAKYKDEESQARTYLQQLRAKETLQGMIAQLEVDGLHWHEEVLDFTSYPWGTIARRRGDCDDFMTLWEAVLKYKEGKTRKIFVAGPTSAHAMLLYTKGDEIWILSNMRILAKGFPGQEEELARRFYGDKTKMVIFY